MSQAKLLYILTQPPYSSAAGQEALDAILIGASFEKQVSVLFLHDAMFQIKDNQQTSDTPIKVYTKTFKALSDFGVESVCVFEQSMRARALQPEDLILPVRQLDQQQVRQLIAEQDRVFVF